MDWDIDVIVRLLAAAILGAAIGWEREVMNRSAGLRTHILVSLGSALFTVLSLTAVREVGKVNDPARIAAQVVSGIGFLGAGTILKHGATVRGLTSAATLWVVAAIGMAAGAACYTWALVTTLISLVTLISLRMIEHDISPHRHIHLDISFTSDPAMMNEIGRLFTELHISTPKLDWHDEDKTTLLSATLNVPDDLTSLSIVQKLRDIGITQIEISD